MAVIERRVGADGKIAFRARVRLKGHPPQTATFVRLTDARRWAQIEEAAIREGRHFKSVEAKKHTLGDLIDRYIRDVLPTKPKSQKQQKPQLIWWKEKLGHYLLWNVTPALLAEHRDQLIALKTRRHKPRSPSTVQEPRYTASVLIRSSSSAANAWLTTTEVGVLAVALARPTPESSLSEIPNEDSLSREYGRRRNNWLLRVESSVVHCVPSVEA